VTHSDHQLAVRRLFEGKAMAWGAKYTGRGALAWRIDSFRRLVGELSPPPGRLLDFGCGTGQLACAFHGKGYDVTGCDVSPAMLAFARRESEEVRWCTLEANQSRLPFDDAEFDVVVASSVLEYVEDVGGVLSEWARVLRPGGTLAFTVPNMRHRTRRIERIAAWLALRVDADAWLGRASSKVGDYLEYIRLSKNRYDVAEWCDRVHMHGLIHVMAQSPGPGTLDLLGFRRAPAATAAAAAARASSQVL
jgi:ubiquinone/menaquinone biosynthesis C-methylase UbiE